MWSYATENFLSSQLFVTYLCRKSLSSTGFLLRAGSSLCFGAGRFADLVVKYLGKSSKMCGMEPPLSFLTPICSCISVPFGISNFAKCVKIYSLSKCSSHTLSLIDKVLSALGMALFHFSTISCQVTNKYRLPVYELYIYICMHYNLFLLWSVLFLCS